MRKSISSNSLVRGRCLVLCRNAETTASPEAKLWLAVLCKAVEDYYSRSKSDHLSAKFFLSSKGFTNVCDYVGLNPQFARELIQEKIDEGRFPRPDQPVP